MPVKPNHEGNNGCMQVCRVLEVEQNLHLVFFFKTLLISHILKVLWEQRKWPVFFFKAKPLLSSSHITLPPWGRYSYPAFEVRPPLFKQRWSHPRLRNRNLVTTRKGHLKQIVSLQSLYKWLCWGNCFDLTALKLKGIWISLNRGVLIPHLHSGYRKLAPHKGRKCFWYGPIRYSRYCPPVSHCPSAHLSVYHFLCDTRDSEDHWVGATRERAHSPLFNTCISLHI